MEAETLKLEKIVKAADLSVQNVTADASLPSAAGAARRSRARFQPRDRRPLRDLSPRADGRGGHEGGKARRRRRDAAHRRRARARSRPSMRASRCARSTSPREAGPRRGARARARGRRHGRQLPARRAAAARPGLRRYPGRQSAHHLLRDLGIRLQRPGAHAAWRLRSRDPGADRHDDAGGQRGRPAGQDRLSRHRCGHRHHRRAGHRDGAARARPHAARAASST